MFRLSAAAEEDLIDIYTRGAVEFGLDRAARYYRRLFDAFQFLAENPLVAPVRPELHHMARVHPVGMHIVIYQVRAGDVFILRVRHGREDWRGQAIEFDG